MTAADHPAAAASGAGSEPVVRDEPASAQARDDGAGVLGCPVAPDGDLVAAVFGARGELAQRYAAVLAGDGVVQGLIGPREVAQLWDRHILNCAHVADLLPAQARVVDVGSGAGLPGLVLAIRRPDVQVDLVEPMLRRSEFLSRTVAELGLGDQVCVVRGRAEEAHVRGGVGSAPFCTARAVAPLERLVRWCVPLLAPGGVLLAMKGARADSEVVAARKAIAAAGGKLSDVVDVGTGAAATKVVRIERLASSRSKGRGAR